MSDLRLFIAVNIDSPEITTSLKNFQNKINFQGIKLVKPTLFHFSLHFLGDTPEEQVSDIKDILLSIDLSSFTIDLVGSGVFPSLQNIKVIWTGVQTGAEELAFLQEQFTKPLEKKGFTIDSRPYKPHLTLARVKFLKPENKKAIQRVILEHKETEFGSQKISSVHLMQSILLPAGPDYQSLFHVDLK